MKKSKIIHTLLHLLIGGSLLNISGCGPVIEREKVVEKPMLLYAPTLTCETHLDTAKSLLNKYPPLKVTKANDEDSIRVTMREFHQEIESDIHFLSSPSGQCPDVEEIRIQMLEMKDSINIHLLALEHQN